MNKMTKGLIAGIAGVALLTSGGTFALWNYQGENRPSVISTGEMSVSTPDGAKWFDQRNGGSINPDTFRASPGDILNVDIPLSVKNTGTNAQALLNVELGTTAEKLAAAGATASFFVFDSKYRILNGNHPAGAKLSAEIAPTPAGGSASLYTMRVTVNISEDSTNASANQLIDLGAITYSLTQVPQDRGEE